MSVLNRKLYELFSQPRHPTVEDIIAVGGVLDAAILRHAYQHGIFPWPHEGYPLLWFAPEKRGVIDFERLHIPRSLLKWMRKNSGVYEVRHDSNFEEVLRCCRQQIRKGQDGTWINDEIEQAYSELFKEGGAFSLEIYKKEELVGGIYGVRSAKYISCESMFHLEENTSKLAFLKLVEKLQSEGQSWMDIQMVTSVCESFGGRLITKDQFLKRIEL